MDMLHSLRVFLAVVDAGSFTAAAKVMRTSLPTVARQMAALEKQLGARLVYRSTRDLALTAEGARFAARVRTLLGTLQDATYELQAAQSSAEGNLSVTAPVVLGQTVVAASIARLVQARPGMRIRLTLQDSVANLIAEGFDLAVRIGDLPDSALIAQRVGRVRFKVVASRHYLEQRGAPKHPDDLRLHNCLRFMGPGAAPWAFRAGDREFVVPTSGNFECSTVGPLLEAAATGLGLVRAQSYQVRPYVLEGRLQVVLEAFELPPHDVSFVYPSAARSSPRIQAVTKWLKGDLREALQPF